MIRPHPPRPAPRTLLAALLALIVTTATPALADVITIDFDTVPALPLAPTTFTDPAQDLAVPGLATITGGTPISTPDGLASFVPGGGLRNGYGTRSGTGNGYEESLTITFDPSIVVSRVTGTLFNGFTDLNSYTVSAFSGAIQIDFDTFDDVEDTTDPDGFRDWDLTGLSITSIVITPDTTFSGGAWDYVIDNVTVTFTAVPEPSSILTLAVGSIGVLALAGSRFRSSTSSPRHG